MKVHYCVEMTSEPKFSTLIDRSCLLKDPIATYGISPNFQGIIKDVLCILLVWELEICHEISASFKITLIHRSCLLILHLQKMRNLFSK